MLKGFFSKISEPETDICYHDDDESSYGLVFNIYNWQDCSDLCVGDATCHRWTYLEEFTKCKKFKAEDVKKYPGVGCTSGGVCIRSGPKPNEPVPGKSQFHYRVSIRILNPVVQPFGFKTSYC